MCRIDDVGTPVAKCTHSEIVPAAPLSHVEVLVVVVVRNGRKPGIPVQRTWNRFFIGKFGNFRIPPVPATRIVHVGCDFCDIFDDPGFFPCLKLEIIGFGVSLITHLGYHIRIFQRSFNQQFRFIKCSGQRFFHVNMFSGFQREHTNGKMRMVGCRNHNGIEILSGFIKHHAEIFECFGFRVVRHCFFSMFCSQIHIAECNDVYHAGFYKFIQHFKSPVAYADKGYIYFVAGTDYPIITLYSLIDCCGSFGSYPAQR